MYLHICKLVQYKLYIGVYSVNEPTETRRFMAAGEPRVVYSYAEEIALTPHNFNSPDQEVKLLRAPINSSDRKRIVQS